MKFLLAVLSFFSCLASAAEQFSNIDGKTYYQVLGVAKDADVPTIKTAYRKLMKEAHPDAPGGSTEKAQKINRAYEVVGDETQEKRKKYDEWLSWQAGGESRRRYQEGGEQHYQERSEAIIREEVIRKMIDEILRQSIAVRKARSDLRLEQLAVNARQILVYYQRFLPGSHWRNEDLFNLFKSHALQPLIYEGWPQEALLAFGGGILLYMQERVHDRG